MRATIAAVLTLCAILSACAGDPPDPAALAEPTPAAPAAPRSDGSLAVTGVAPVSSDGSLTVVIFEPLGDDPVTFPDDPVEMDQYGMEFQPPVLLATIGQPVHFTNSEDVLHNIRVYHIDTKETAFNISTPIGGTYEHRFETAGTYVVACDMHAQMGASVVVTTTPYATVADRDGAFSVDAVPPGPYTVHVQAGSARTRHAITIADGATTLTLGGD